MQSVVFKTLRTINLSDIEGRELADLLVKFQPGMKVLFASGYANNSIVYSGIQCAEIFYAPKYCIYMP
jgi:hypothetical protein